MWRWVVSRLSGGHAAAADNAPLTTRRPARVPHAPQLTEALLSSPESEVPLAAKVAIAEAAAGADKKLADGADEELQLTEVMMLANRAIKGALLAADTERQVII